MLSLKCSYQTYEWGEIGSRSTVAQLLKSASSEFEINEDQPYAELWMGTHPNGPSKFVNAENSLETLENWINQNKECLGGKVLEKFGAQLPFLFKVLSVNKALSIQAHPNKIHAQELHKLRPDLYKDPNHKPEMAIALTPFEALCGFRPRQEIIHFIKNIPELKYVIGEKNAKNLELGLENALQLCFRALMTTTCEVVRDKLIHLKEKFSKKAQEELLSSLFLRLYSQYPEDIGCFGIYFFNYVKLKLGEALYLAANEPHAYLAGDCIECMACSDNVVRAGLTPKFKDVDTLCSMLTYRTATAKDQLFAGKPVDEFSTLFSPPVPDFAIIKTEIPTAVTGYRMRVLESACIVLCVCGEAVATDEKERKVQLKRGSVVFIAASSVINLTMKPIGMLLFTALGNV